MLALQIASIIVTVLMIASILLQQRGSGLGDAFGDTSAVYTSRRGSEKILFYLTIVFGASFVVLAILQIYLTKI